MTEALVSEILNLARDKGLTVATAESCTGGLVSAALTEVPGSSDVFERGVVTYSNAAKIELLGVEPDLIERHGAVSGEVARAMAEGALASSGADLGVSVTGVAGPGHSAQKPEGLVWFGLAQRGAATLTHMHEFGALGRTEVRRRSCIEALNLVLQAVENW